MNTTLNPLKPLALVSGIVVFGPGCFFSDCAQSPWLGDHNLGVTGVSAGADIAIDAGSTTCTFSGYTWACSPCADIEVPLGHDALIQDSQAKFEWVSGEPGLRIKDSNALKTTATIGGITPTQQGCISPEYPIDLKVIGDDGVLRKDRVTIAVTCCGT
jgi:hypothetical protein